jgi:hypothetical protein
MKRIATPVDDRSWCYSNIVTGVQINEQKCALYKSLGSSRCCPVCIVGVGPDPEPRQATALRAPSFYSKDLATLVAAMLGEDGMAHACSACAAQLASGDIMATAGFGMQRITTSPRVAAFQDPFMPSALAALMAVYLYAWATTNLGVTDAPSPALRFANEITARYPTQSPPIHGVPISMTNQWTRDMGLGCYLSFIPLGNVVYLQDFASKKKHRGNGAIAFRKICEIADHNTVTLSGVIQPHGKWGGRKDALSAKQLLRWYRRFGFVEVVRKEAEVEIAREPCSPIAPT